MPSHIRSCRDASCSDRGASAVEYALLVVAIALVMVVGAFLLGDALDERFSKSSNCVKGSSVANCS